MTPDRHVLVLKDPDALAPGRLSELLLPFVDVPRPDLAVSLATGGGTLLDGVDRGTADAAAEALRTAGFGTVVLDADRWVDLPRTLKVIRADLTPDGLEAAIGHDRNWQTVPWPAIRFVHVYATQELVVDHEVQRARSLFDPRDRIYSAEAARLIEEVLDYEEERGDRRVKLHVKAFAFDPVGLYRFDRKGFHYDYLGGEVRSHSIDNFLLLCRHLLGYARDAVVPRSTRSFVREPGVHGILFDRDEARRGTERTWLNLILAREWGLLPEGEGPRPGPPFPTREELREAGPTGSDRAPAERSVLATIRNGVRTVEEVASPPPEGSSSQEVAYRVLDGAGVPVARGEARARLSMEPDDEGPDVGWRVHLTVPWPEAGRRLVFDVLGTTVVWNPS